MFTGELNNILFKNIDFFNLLTMNNIVPRNIRYFYFININASKLTTLEKLFNYINCLQYAIFENVDFSNVISIEKMFVYVSNNKYDNGLISFKNINFSNLYKIENFIKGYYWRNISLENINFSNLSSLEKVIVGESNNFESKINLININAPKVTSMNNIFYMNRFYSLKIKDLNIPNCLTMENLTISHSIKSK